ncbi:hypothetical protein GCM10011492_23550 [Flexivirga endophytica]|uniref:Uncharacterized protein n=1 Tax=Flexivirga endophytica TaxID=1849103 RepID=A0A916T7I4_9MICO|nr:hypothetical protein GCM10011492_23550 [Flexivirga endophytica]GHB53095.1 hypothetical protein GCM10008112_22830 [Flexivirga endophytica]
MPERLQRLLDLLGAGDGRVDRLDRADLATADPLRHPGRVVVAQRVVGESVDSGRPLLVELVLVELVLVELVLVRHPHQLTHESTDE